MFAPSRLSGFRVTCFPPRFVRGLVSTPTGVVSGQLSSPFAVRRLGFGPGAGVQLLTTSVVRAVPEGSSAAPHFVRVSAGFVVVSWSVASGNDP